MSNRKLWNAALIFSGFCFLILYKLTANIQENNGPIIKQRAAQVRLIGVATVEALPDRHRPNLTISEQVFESGNDVQGKPSNKGNEMFSKSLHDSSTSLEHQSYDDEEHAVDADDDDGEASIADIWEEYEEDDDAWKKFEVEYETIAWKANPKAFHEWRSGLEMYGVDSRKNFLITNDSVELKSVLPFYMSTQHTYTVSELFMGLIPKQTPYNEKSLGRCAVVGNSGILSQSGCGKNIDSADYIFRCNIPPLTDYADDVGEMTDLTTMNPSMIEIHQGTVSFSRQREYPYNLVLEPYDGIILLSCFSHYFYLRMCIKAIKQYYRENANMTFLHPEHFITIWDYWKDHGMSHLPSTGFYIVNTAVTLCDQIDIYGFWPFDKTSFSGKPERVRYHYYEEGQARPAHDMIGEFSTLFQLHRDGALRIHLGNCSTT